MSGHKAKGNRFAGRDGASQVIVTALISALGRWSHLAKVIFAGRGQFKTAPDALMSPLYSKRWCR